MGTLEQPAIDRDRPADTGADRHREAYAVTPTGAQTSFGESHGVDVVEDDRG
jgi:hypothetical protein